MFWDRRILKIISFPLIGLPGRVGEQHVDHEVAEGRRRPVPHALLVVLVLVAHQLTAKHNLLGNVLLVKLFLAGGKLWIYSTVFRVWILKMKVFASSRDLVQTLKTVE